MRNAGGDALTEQLAIRGPRAFAALMQSALKPYKESVVGWSSSVEKPTVGRQHLAGPPVKPARASTIQGDLNSYTTTHLQCLPNHAALQVGGLL